jgi:hypothetical protein
MPDDVGERPEQLVRHVVTHPVDDEQLGARDGARRGATAGDVHHLVGGPVHHCRRDAQAAQRV